MTTCRLKSVSCSFRCLLTCSRLCLPPLARLLQAIVRRDRATPCTVLRVCTLTEWATPAPRLQAHRSHVRRGSGTIAELKIDPFLVPGTSLLQLSDVSSHALLDTQAGRSSKHTNRHTSAEKAHSEPSHARKNALSKSHSHVPAWVQQHIVIKTWQIFV